MRNLIGIAVGFLVGFGCGVIKIPVPAPSVLLGALLVFTMTLGYRVGEWWCQKRSN